MQRLRALAAAMGGLVALGISTLFEAVRESSLLRILIFSAGIVIGDQIAEYYRRRRASHEQRSA